MLATFYEDLPKRSETWQASTSSIKDLAAEDEDGRQLNQAPEVPQASAQCLYTSLYPFQNLLESSWGYSNTFLVPSTMFQVLLSRDF
jgi:hypothetical protein